MSQKVSVAILGSTGYVGLELVKILSKHPEVEIFFLELKIIQEIA